MHLNEFHSAVWGEFDYEKYICFQSYTEADEKHNVLLLYLCSSM